MGVFTHDSIGSLPNSLPKLRSKNFLTLFLTALLALHLAIDVEFNNRDYDRRLRQEAYRRRCRSRRISREKQVPRRRFCGSKSCQRHAGKEFLFFSIKSVFLTSKNNLFDRLRLIPVLSESFLQTKLRTDLPTRRSCSSTKLQNLKGLPTVTP